MLTSDLVERQRERLGREAQELDHRQRRVRVVELDRHLVRELGELVAKHEAVVLEDVLDRARDEEDLLEEA